MTCWLTLVLQLVLVSLCAEPTQPSKTSSGVPPELVDSIPSSVDAILAKRIVLSCKNRLEDLTDSVEWLKDGDRFLTPVTKRFMKTKTYNLVIKKVELEDVGVYSCEVTNGFGTSRRDIKLNVLDPNRRGLYWTNPEFIQHQESNVLEVKEGNPFTLKCEAQSVETEHMSLVWKRFPSNSRVKSVFITGANDQDYDYTVHSAIPSHSGRYRCEVTSPVSQSDALISTMTVQVIANEEHFYAPLNNLTINEGQTDKLRCSVASQKKPTIHWVGPSTIPHPKNQTPFTYESDGKKHEFLQLDFLNWQTEPKQLEDGRWESELTIIKPTIDMTGWYACLAFGHGQAKSGIPYSRKAYVRVVPVAQAIPSSNETPILAIIGVPVLIILLIVVGYAIFFLRRNQQKHEPIPTHVPKLGDGLTTSNGSTGSNVYRPPPPNQPPPSCPPSSSHGHSKTSNPLLNAYLNSQQPQPHQQTYIMPAAQKIGAFGSSNGSPGVRQVPSGASSSAKYYHQFDPQACMPLNSPYMHHDHMPMVINGHLNEDLVDASHRDNYESTPQPYDIRYDVSDFSDSCSDLNPGGRMQHYPSLYSCR